MWRKSLITNIFEGLSITVLGFVALYFTKDMPYNAAIFPRIVSVILIILGMLLPNQII